MPWSPPPAPHRPVPVLAPTRAAGRGTSPIVTGVLVLLAVAGVVGAVIWASTDDGEGPPAVAAEPPTTTEAPEPTPTSTAPVSGPTPGSEPTVEEVDEPGERVPHSDAATGVTWTMQRSAPVSEQSFAGIPTTQWIIDLGDELEMVAVYRTAGAPFLVDEAIRGMAAGSGGSARPIEDTTVAGRPGRTALIDMGSAGLAVARVSVVPAGDSYVVLMVAALAERLDVTEAKHALLEASLRLG